MAGRTFMTKILGFSLGLQRTCQPAPIQQRGWRNNARARIRAFSICARMVTARHRHAEIESRTALNESLEKRQNRALLARGLDQGRKLPLCRRWKLRF
jgi:hypothetical protein